MTPEQIDELERSATLIYEDNGLHVGKGMLEALCKLARIGLAVQPRPIEECDVLGSRCLFFSGSQFRCVDWWYEPWKANNTRWPEPLTHFIPLSAIPTEVKRLGPEFEKAIFENVEELYEP